MVHCEGRPGVRGCRHKRTTLTVFSELIQSLLKTTGIFPLLLTGAGLGSAFLILKQSPTQLHCYLLQRFSSDTQKIWMGLQTPCMRGRINTFSFCLQIILRNSFKKRKKSFKQISILPTGLVHTFLTCTILYQYLLHALALCSGDENPCVGRKSMWMQPLAELEALGNTKVNV